MNGLSKALRLIGLALGVFVTVICFQNCTSTMQGQTVGGVGTDGMNQAYQYFNTSQPCANVNLNGSPLPNAMIIVAQDTTPYLSRQNCQDMGLLAINPQDLQVTPGTTTSFTYKNQTFSSVNTTGAFDILRPPCPAGTTAIPGATWTNLINASLSWMAREIGGVPGTGWDIYSGISVSLFNSIESLPAFLVQRNDPNSLDAWRRTAQDFSTLKANTNYAFTFLAQPGTVNSVDWLFIRCITPSCATTQDESVTVTIDFQSLSSTVKWAFNISNVNAVVTPLGTGYAVTVYFTSSATDDQSGNAITIGVTPSASGNFGQVGDSIVATAAELVEVPSVCH